LAVLSHELRTPLAPVLAAVELLQRKGEVSREEQHYLDMIRRNLELEARLIDDLLDLTRIVRGKVVLERKPVDIVMIPNRVVDICRPDIEARNLRFNIDLEDTPYTVRGDASRLQQVFWNVLKNSVKFTPHGGHIGVSGYRAGSRIVIEISDTGIGIEPENLTKVFNAFEQGEQRVTRQFGGLGLGLAITKRLIEMHWGSVSAHSRGKGRGATFKISRPMLPEQPAWAEEGEKRESRSEEKKPSRGKTPARILLVEDHSDTAAMMHMLLESSGYEVETAVDADQALTAMEHGSFDLLISDLGLPDRSGLELMQDLRRAGSTIKAVALSGYGREEDIVQSKKAGFSEHLTKPVNADVLIETLERLG